MSNAQQTSINLVPEQRLMASLSPLWKRRFEKAISYIMETLDQSPPPSWDEIAKQCAISPYHFHRMFKVVFGETPGQYVARVRLQWAVTLLLDTPDISVSEVALECGFSSSQALAKALKRDLKVTAREIRQLQNNKEYSALEKILIRVGHPGGGSDNCMEQSIARDLQFHITSLPERYLAVEKVQSGLISIVSHWYFHMKDNHKPIYMVTPPEFVEENLAVQKWIMIGQEVSSQQSNRLTLAAGDYLNCRVTISSEVGYMAVWDAFFDHMVQNDLEPDDKGGAVEIVHDPKSILSETTEMTLSLKLKTT